MSSREADPLLGKEDSFDGLILDPDALPHDPAEFSRRLGASLPAWRARGYRGIWLKLPKHLAHSVGPAVDAGFDFHHAEREYVMLTRWLPEDEPNTLPPNASHQVGVGAFVTNEHAQVLAVQERFGPLRGKGIWKLPTGLVHMGEDITDTAEREVLEETGIRARFAGLVAIRQAHNFSFGKSDLFFAVALKADPGQEVVNFQREELDAAQWMPVDEFMAQPFYTERPLFRRLMHACRRWSEGRGSVLAQCKLTSDVAARHDLLLLSEVGDGSEEDDAALDQCAGVAATPFDVHH